MATTADAFVEPLTSKPAIADLIRDQIVTGRLAMGARIADKQLATDLSVSRTPVREALLQLQSEGLVEIKPQSGTFVFSLTAADIGEICALRVILETGAIRSLLAGNAKESLVLPGLIVGRAALALEDGDMAACDALDWQFHESLIAATGNQYLIRAYRGISSQLRALRQRMPRHEDRIAQAIAQHRRLIDLCAAGRLDAAVEQISGHVGNVERLLTIIGERG
tara:strand:+ start:970 stop:1638 length:669 start_codon:yes stop_codon:yes gene_type:complete